MNKNDAYNYAKNVAEEINSGISADEFLDSALDVEISTDLRHQYRGATIAITIGSPYCRLDTRSKLVLCNWGTQHGEYPVSDEFCDAIEDYLSDLFQEVRG